MSYDYQTEVELACNLLGDLEGATLLSVRINVVEPEYNVVYLDTSNGVFALQGEVGGEYLGVHRKAEMPDITDEDGYIICAYPPFEEFVGSVISQARQMGSIWHGHGFEIAFKGIPDKSMMIQSIYCGSEPEGLTDCLRLGIGYYSNEWSRT